MTQFLTRSIDAPMPRFYLDDNQFPAYSSERWFCNFEECLEPLKNGENIKHLREILHVHIYYSAVDFIK